MIKVHRHRHPVTGAAWVALFGFVGKVVVVIPVVKTGSWNERPLIGRVVLIAGRAIALRVAGGTNRNFQILRLTAHTGLGGVGDIAGGPQNGHRTIARHFGNGEGARIIFEQVIGAFHRHHIVLHGRWVGAKGRVIRDNTIGAFRDGIIQHILIQPPQNIASFIAIVNVKFAGYGIAHPKASAVFHREPGL